MAIPVAGSSLKRLFVFNTDSSRPFNGFRVSPAPYYFNIFSLNIYFSDFFPFTASLGRRGRVASVEAEARRIGLEMRPATARVSADLQRGGTGLHLPRLR